MPKYKILQKDALENELNTLENWQLEENGLERKFTFQDFIEAFSFLTKVAICAEKLNHHPEIYNSYNTVIIKGLCTHDADNKITTLDIELARQISILYNRN